MIVCLVVLSSGCGGDSGPGAGSDVAPAVEAVPARRGSLPLEEELSGVVRALNQVSIRPEISGTVVDVRARNGDAVVTGQPLVRLDDETLREQSRRAGAELRDAEAAAAEARARVAEVRARVVRTRELAVQGLTSDLELETLEAQLAATMAEAEQTEAQVEQARATVQERRAALSKATVVAPVDGRVGQRDVEVGMVVGPASTLFLLGDFEELTIEVPLTQEMLRVVDVGTPVEIGVRDREPPILEAEISRISPFLEAASFSTTAEIDILGGNQGLRPGMFVTVRLLYGSSAAATLVPASAIWESPLSGDPTVFVVDDAKGLIEPKETGDEIPAQPRAVSVRPVEVLAEGRGQVGLRGLQEGEWVVTLGQHLLQEQLDAVGPRATTARVRPTSWNRIIGLQSLQREDLLERFLSKQRVVAGALGAELPDSTAAVEEVLRAAGASPNGDDSAGER